MYGSASLRKRGSTTSKLGVRSRGKGDKRSMAIALRGVPAPATVDQQHRDDHHAVDDVPAEFLDLHDRQDGLQERDEDYARDRAEIAAAPAKDRRAAQHDRGDRGKQIRI